MASDTSLKPETRHLETGPMGLLLLQSYSPDAATTTVRFAEGRVLLDAETRDPLPVTAGDLFTVKLAADYGTRLFYVLRSPQEPSLLPKTPRTALVDDFELGFGFQLGTHSRSIRVVADSAEPRNHVLRIAPGHPAQHVLRPQNVVLPDDYQWSFRFRLAALPEKVGKAGFLTLGYRDADKRRYHFGLGFERSKDSRARWTVSPPLLVYDGGRNEGYQAPNASGGSVPVQAADTQWHMLTVRVTGPEHTILVDDQPVFAGRDERNLTGGFMLAPGWGWDPAIGHVEIDDIRVEALP